MNTTLKPQSANRVTKFITIFLGMAIIVVGEAADGREAINLISEPQPDVVLMEASMPVMDGLKAIRLVKAQWPHIRVIVQTIHTALWAEALAAGADVFLVKGCPADELLAANLEC